MRPVELLAEIEQLDLRRSELEQQLKGVEDRARGDKELATLQSRQRQLQAEAKQLVSALRQAELEVEELRQRARDHERAIYDGSVRNEAGLKRRQHELETLRRRMGEMEEAEIVQMEQQERLAADIAETDRLVKEREEAVRGAGTRDAQRLPGLRRELEEVAERRAELAADLAPADLRLYERTAARHRPAVARVASGVCSGCRLPLAPRVLQAARHQELVPCESCERLLLL